jgi:carboxyl-terminal processing protease
MRRRVIAARIVGFAALLLLATVSVAQQSSTIALSARSIQVTTLLERGQQLEGERRWGEALVHYEDALRLFPEESSLERHFELARLHYDLGRRYADRSFCENVSRLTSDKAVQLYEQVLLKIQSHYVELAGWKDLAARGTRDFEVALGEPAFAKRHLQGCDAAQLAAFRAELRAMVAGRAIQSRRDVCDTAAAAAALAEARLAVPATAVILEYLCGAANSLDPYSSYLTPDQLTEVYSQIEGNFVGLGVELKAQDRALVIVHVITGSPAETAGVRPGDRIVAIDGRAMRDIPTDRAANLLQGPEGSVVRLTVAGADQRNREVTVRRQRVEVPSVDQVQMLDSRQGVAYLKLTCFQKTTRRDLEAALWKLHRGGMRSLIVDLRGNPGGLLMTAVEVSNLFVDHGVIVSTHGRNTDEDFTYIARPEGAWRVPLTLIIDQESASAAEIFAGAMRDHHRGTLVGTRSFGKGSVQGIFPLGSSDSGLRLTTAKFYSPNGRAFARVGVDPDVLVHQAARPINGAVAGAVAGQEDSMLAAAVDLARKAAGQPVQATLSRN